MADIDKERDEVIGRLVSAGIRCINDPDELRAATKENYYVVREEIGGRIIERMVPAARALPPEMDLPK